MQRVRVTVYRRRPLGHLIKMTLSMLMMGFFGLIAVSSAFPNKYQKDASPRLTSEFFIGCVALAGALLFPMLLFAGSQRFEAVKDGVIWRRGWRKPVKLRWCDIRQFEWDARGNLILQAEAGFTSMRIPGRYEGIESFVSILEREVNPDGDSYENELFAPTSGITRLDSSLCD